jgi:phenylacetate-CoA ligase
MQNLLHSWVVVQRHHRSLMKEAGSRMSRSARLRASAPSPQSPASSPVSRAPMNILGWRNCLTAIEIIRTYRELNRAQWLPTEELRARSQARLARLLHHAAENVPFYRGRDPDNLPVMDKSIYRNHAPEAFIASNVPANRRVERATSGSTDVPYRFVVDRETLPVAFASQLSYDSWIGLRPYDRCLRIAVPQAPARNGAPSPPWLQRLYENWTQQRISVWDIDAQRAEDIWHRIEAFRPKFIFGYTSTLATLADLLRSRDLAISRPLRGVITTAETLTPPRRRLIEEYFRAPITNRYGLREFGWFAAQSCPVSPERFHVNSELVICEILGADGLPAEDGETGRIVLTDLWNYARPFIRYDTGDLAARVGVSCSCGRGFPLLGPIEGRSQECLTTVAGKVIIPAVLGHYVFVHNRYGDAARHYQIIQEGPRRVTLLVVPGEAWNEQLAARCRYAMSELLGPEMHSDVRAVAHIRPEKSGKRPIVKAHADGTVG